VGVVIVRSAVTRPGTSSLIPSHHEREDQPDGKRDELPG
jgi:hypothetical protein